MNDDAPQTTVTAPPPATFRLSRVLLIVVPIALLMVGGYVFFGMFNGMAMIETWIRPPLIPVTGKLTMNGEPLHNAQIVTKPLNGRLKGSIGFVENGEFSLMIDTGGRYEDGAYVGKHKVTVAAYGPHPPATQPPLLTPEVYLSFATTPLEFVVSKDPKQNHWEIDVKGEAPPSTLPPEGARPPGNGPPGGRGGPGGARPEGDTPGAGDEPPPPIESPDSSKAPAPADGPAP